MFKRPNAFDQQTSSAASTPAATATSAPAQSTAAPPTAPVEETATATLSNKVKVLIAVVVIVVSYVVLRAFGWDGTVWNVGVMFPDPLFKLLGLWVVKQAASGSYTQLGYVSVGTVFITAGLTWLFAKRK